MTNPSDAALVTAIRCGEVERFSEVVRRFDRTIRLIAARGIRDPDGREEVVQQTFYLAFRRLDSLADPARLHAWLATIARNCLIDYRRRCARRKERPLEERAERAHNDWLWEEVEALPATLAEALRLRYRERLTYAELAERLEVPASTIRGRIYLARRALRRRLEEDA